MKMLNRHSVGEMLLMSDILKLDVQVTDRMKVLNRHSLGEMLLM
jgi:hypothetical protein